MSFFNILSNKKTLDFKQEACLYKKYYKTVYRTIYYCIKNKEITKELTNEAFITAFEKFYTLKDISKFKSWICAIGTNLAKKYIQKNSKLYFIEDYNNLSIVTNNIENEIIEKMDREMKLDYIKKSLEKINPQYKEIIILRYYCDMTYIEIAGHLDISIGTVKSRISRAKKQIINEVQIIEKEGVNYAR
ncbi:RNA polymerase sigma factor [Maledivibacter halophilus]|nr:sigma-70 family RNA polymerase sigma factor [Maledivibacter halophilus]